MLALEEYVEVHALRRRGWSISAISRHLGRDRKTVRAYLLDERVPGERAPAERDPFDEVAALGYAQSYPTFVRKVRHRGLRPSCGACAGTRGGATAIIDHPPGEECQSVLVGTWGHPLAIKSARAGWGTFAFGPVSCLDHLQPGPAAPGGGH